jgi:hypothetical protein
VLCRNIDPGGWEGRGSAAFAAEMSGTVLPALQRLTGALGAAQDITREAARTMHGAEQEAAAFFQNADSLISTRDAAGKPVNSGVTPSDHRVAPGDGETDKPPVRQPATSPPGKQADTEVNYAVNTQRPYGPKWKGNHPPGLPAEARQSSASGAALPFIEYTAQTHNLGDTFVRTVKHLASTESGATFALPAHKFDNRLPDQRDGHPLITAWGVFQFNRDAWRALPGVGKHDFPWNCTPQEEIERPVARYAELFQGVQAAGGSDLDAARGIRLWHRSPAAYRKFLQGGRQDGFTAAWADVPSQHQAKVDKHLGNAGIL